MNAILWLRVSDASQSEDNQLPDLQRWCGEHGYRPVMTVRVHGKSAWKAGRLDADKQQVLQALSSGLASVVVAWSVDRWSRGGIADLLDGMRAVKERGGQVEFVKDSALNVEGPAQELLLAVLAWVARWESEHKSARVRNGMERQRADGLIMGGHVPTGYRLVKGVRVRDEGKLKLVAGIFERSARGESVPVIRDWLAREGCVLGERTIADVIRNPLYVTGKVVSASLAKAALAGLEARRKGEARRTNGQDYSAMVWCRCGLVMHRKPSGGMPAKGVSPTLYYRCSGEKQAHPGKGSPVPMVRCDDADRIVEHVMGADTWPWMIPVRTGGDTREAAVARLQGTLRTAKTRAESDAIWDQIEAVQASEPEPERTEWVESGLTRGQHWARLTIAERRAWLESEGTRIITWNVRESAGPDITVAEHAWALGKVRLVVEHGE